MAFRRSKRWRAKWRNNSSQYQMFGSCCLKEVQEHSRTSYLTHVAAGSCAVGPSCGPSQIRNRQSDRHRDETNLSIICISFSCNTSPTDTLIPSPRGEDMAKATETYTPMEMEFSESDTFLVKPLKSILSRRRNLDKQKIFTISGWVVSIFLFGILTHTRLYPRKPTDIECTRQLNAESPVFDVVEYEDVMFSNQFYQPSPYKGRPTPELEKAWKDLWWIGTIDVPWEYLPGLNKSVDRSWAKTTKGGVLGGLEVFHTLHCLDMVRQYTWRDQYDYSDNPTFQDDDEFLRYHVDHCIEAIRIRLMCYADVTPFLHIEEPGAEAGLTPDFDTQHKCKKFDKIQEWQRAHLAGHPKKKGGAGHDHGGHGHDHIH